MSASDNQSTELGLENDMLLMACVHRGEEMADQQNAISDVSHRMGQILRVCMMDEEQDKLLVKKYRIGGTPTYILFRGNEERARLLGKVDAKTLFQFVQSHLGKQVN